MGAAASDRSALFFFPSMTGFAMPRVFAALLLPHDVCDALARDAKAFARIDPLPASPEAPTFT